MRRYQQSDPALERNWVFELAEPVLDVEVSLLAAPGAHTDWVHGAKRDEAIRVVVEHCSALFAQEIGGRVGHVRHSHFNHHGMTVHATIVARHTERLDDLIERDLGALERSLEATLQSHFGWEQAAVSVQIDPNPAYEARGGRRTMPRPGHRDDINVWQPGGGSNAIAPVIVTVPSASETGAIKPHAHDGTGTASRGSAAVAGLLGAVLAIGIAILVGVTVGPLLDEIAVLNQDREIITRDYETALQVRNERIDSLQRENGRLQDTVSRLASRRGQPAARSDQPTRTLPDTGAVSPLGAASPSLSPGAAAGAP